MKFFIKNNDGYCEELSLKSQTIKVSTFFNYLQLSLNEEVLSDIKMNGMDYTIYPNEAREYIIPCYMTRENNTTIQLTIGRKQIRLVIKYVEELFVGETLIDHFADFHRSLLDWLNGETKSVAQLIQAIQSGEIHLLQIINPLTGLDDETILDDIYKVLPLALDICTKPRQHLRVEEEVMDVELVKRITPSSLQHLASHSEHWRSRTITGLVPSRLRAEIYEDDINIYENIFFKMVIEAILQYIVKKHEQVKLAISQKDTLHDWEFYASETNDYHKLEMLQSLLPQYDGVEEEKVRKQYQDLSDKLKVIEKQLSSIISTPFFQKLDATKRLELPIQPTNIINMDNRYNELFQLWNKLLSMQNKTQEDLTGASILNTDEYYDAYIQVLIIYSLHLLGYEFHHHSMIEKVDNEPFTFTFSFHNDYCVVHASSRKEGLKSYLSFTIEESLSYELNVPHSFPVSFKEYEDSIVFQEIWRENQQVLIFREKPSTSLQRKLSLVVKKHMDEQKGLSASKQIELKKLDVEWRKVLTEELAKIPPNRKYELNVHGLFRNVGTTESMLQKYSTLLLDSAPVLDEGTTIYMLPVNMSDFRQIENNQLLQRLINMGEAYSEKDASQYGDYQSGILPISQTDLRSIQRLSKLFNMYINRQLLRWGTKLKECPVCKSENIHRVDEHSWQCRNLECQLVWGVTKCSSGCEQFYEWMRPTLKVKLSKQPEPYSEGYHLQKILLNEMLFDRSVITAFSYQVDAQNNFTYQPICPKCGHHR